MFSVLCRARLNDIGQCSAVKHKVMDSVELYRCDRGYFSMPMVQGSVLFLLKR